MPDSEILKQSSIFNHVIGPVMHGPSSSHTAGAFHIGAICRSLIGGNPTKAQVSFDTNGSYGKTYHEQGADRSFITGLMGWKITDDRFYDAMSLAASAGVDISFDVKELENPNHPNTVEIELLSTDGNQLSLRANSIGGGAVEFISLNDYPININGYSYEILVEIENSYVNHIVKLLTDDNKSLSEINKQEINGLSLLHVRRNAPLPEEAKLKLKSLPGFKNLWIADPVFFIQVSEPIFYNTREMIKLAHKQKISLGELALEYESSLLGLSKKQVMDEMIYRMDIMCSSVDTGLTQPPKMQLINPTAQKIFNTDSEGKLPTGGLHTRAAIRAMAVMHVNGGMGVVCAAPTGGAAGTIPGVISTLLEEQKLSKEKCVLALLAAGAIGLIVSNRATFAAEVAGCQVEIGAAGAMAAAAVVDAFGGSVKQASDAAAISFQNTMGSVCDLVQGMVEIPCHTRNALAASSAFVCADLIMGGYENPIDLDETIDAVYSVGKMLPAELRCTALGGLAVTPSALAMKPSKFQNHKKT
ncbi:hypothetical protein GF312_22720 [Candidatus Poribacteria bacterium]|nr:hypothetical protein [Candidatus Poribacteria bacterium]